MPAKVADGAFAKRRTVALGIVVVMVSSFELPPQVAELLGHQTAEECIDAASGYCWAFHRAELLLWRFQDGARPHVQRLSVCLHLRNLLPGHAAPIKLAAFYLQEPKRVCTAAALHTLQQGAIMSQSRSPRCDIVYTSISQYSC